MLTGQMKVMSERRATHISTYGIIGVSDGHHDRL